MNMDISKAIEPKSDQINADSLLSGPRTIKIKNVSVVDGEQPISISFEGDQGKPWKPCKTAARCLAIVWGPDASKWIGKSCTIYNDPTVTWAGMAVGGIRVSHMEGLTSKRVLQLTKTRGQKGATTIEPLHITPPVEINVPAAQESAKNAAKGGKDSFTVWWNQNKDKREAVQTIMPEIQKIAAEADAAKSEPAGDEIPFEPNEEPEPEQSNENVDI